MSVTLFRGDTFTRAWTFPLDLTGATAKLDVRSASDGLVHAASTDNGQITITIVSPTSSTVALRIDAEYTATWAVGVYEFDLEITYATGIVKTYGAADTEKKKPEKLTVIKDKTYD